MTEIESLREENRKLRDALRVAEGALDFAEQLFNAGVFGAQDGLWEKVHSSRRSALAQFATLAPPLKDSDTAAQGEGKG